MIDSSVNGLVGLRREGEKDLGWFPVSIFDNWPDD